MKKLIFFALALIGCTLVRTSITPESRQNSKKADDLVVIVNASTGIDSLTEGDLQYALRGRDDRFKLVGFQAQYYHHIVKEMAKLSPGEFEREWLRLVITGQRRTNPIITDDLLHLVSLVAKDKYAIAVLSLSRFNAKPAALGIRMVKIFKQ